MKCDEMEELVVHCIRVCSLDKLVTGCDTS
jgi:hypothetical protein